MSLTFDKVIYGHYKDKEQPLQFQPEADLGYPYIYRMYIKSLDDGEYITFSDEQDYWAQIPKELIGNTDENRVFKADVELEILLDLSRLYTRFGGFGAFQVDITRYNPEIEQRAYTEQTALLVLTEEGTKIGLE